MTTALTAEAHPQESSAAPDTRYVTYLIGAGASQACINFVQGNVRLLMNDIRDDVLGTVLTHDETHDHSDVEGLVNEAIRNEYDIEQVISFLSDSPSHRHQGFSTCLRGRFEHVLRGRLAQAVEQLGRDLAFLYAALIDMHNVENGSEKLRGILTLNYDNFIETAVSEFLSMDIDYGIHAGQSAIHSNHVRILKLHGSYSWRYEWPISVNTTDEIISLWIPPGIRKAKGEYPFNVLWGMATELLDCDVLRIVGCRLSTNDWDLVSMLFAAKHAHSAHRPLEIEVIDWPAAAHEIQRTFPYLEARSLLDLEVVGDRIRGEAGAGTSLDLEDEDPAWRDRIPNPFATWLQHRAEVMALEIDSIETDTNTFSTFLERLSS